MLEDERVLSCFQAQRYRNNLIFEEEPRFICRINVHIYLFNQVKAQTKQIIKYKGPFLNYKKYRNSSLFSLPAFSHFDLSISPS